ncbi:MAG: glycosyltransferase, partial [Acidobacteriota bacterium]
MDSQATGPRRSELPRLCLVGPHLGRHAGWVTTQSEVVAELFERSGHPVLMTSSQRSPVLRPLAMARDLVRWRGRYDAVILSIYGGRAFYAAELASRAAAAPQVHVLHGGLLPELAASRPSWVRRTLGRASAVVAPSPFLARTARDLGLEARVIPNVLDLEGAPFRHRERLGEPLEILWVRTFHDLYRPELAVEVLARLVRRGTAARLTLAGQDKGREAACRELA